MSGGIGSTPETVVAPQAPPAQATADPSLVEQIRTQTIKDIFGDKYKDATAAKKGYWDGVKYIGELEGLVNESRATTAQPNDPFKRLQDETLMPMDAFAQAVTKVVRDELGAVLGPVMGAQKARDAYVAQNPQYIEDEPKVLTFLMENPELNQKIQALNTAGFATEALQLQHMAYLKAHPPVSQPSTDLRAGLPGSPGSGPSRAPENTADKDAAARLLGTLQHALRTKDEAPLWNEVFKDFKVKLPPGAIQGA